MAVETNPVEMVMPVPAVPAVVPLMVVAVLQDRRDGGGFGQALVGNYGTQRRKRDGASQDVAGSVSNDEPMRGSTEKG